ncbi:alpha/beta hydrolase [Brucepastera parasyntrophica]|uniref:alpha/beta hydrolase n=1 Tax=Brucepastera parasyntrophica TaxID=2880008 RepID=UPI00210D02C5|nr:alpha/beta hydrolase [Brucepastera parasyntrophica]ULQ60031.1 alpha/beta hydrolase [Brucepastera parasyntrophica]
MSADLFYLTASDGEKIAIHSWEAVKNPRAVIQISHGMAEFAMRYETFAFEANKSGFIVFAADHRGHGETAGSLEKLGYLADKDGFERVMEDQHELTLEINRRYQGLPVILFGHSFGSFISQMYIEHYGTLLKGCILSGTRGPAPVEVFFGSIVSGIISFFGGKKKPSKLLDSIIFGNNNKKIDDPKSKSSWISRDDEEVEKYDASPWSGFIVTAGFFKDLMHGLSRIHRKKAIRNIPSDLPVFIFSGTDDPVGAYGKTVANLAEEYEKNNITNVKLTLYPGGRHEMLNEINREEVIRDILEWINEVLQAG